MKNNTASRWRCFYLFGLLAAFSTIASAKEFANVEYLCCAWGPAMTLPSKPGEKPQFDDGQEEVYFLKQLGTFSRGLMGGEQGHGISIYLCKMKADGSDKTEIKELWHDVRYPIDTQGQSCWMDVNTKTRKIAFSVTYAGSDLTGLWTVGLDGSDFKQIIATVQNEKGLKAIDSPSWTPDGQWIVYAEAWRGGSGYARIAKCNLYGTNQTYLTMGPDDFQSRMSPDGKQIAYIHNIKDSRRLYLMNSDGSDQHPLPNPGDRRWGMHGGSYPAWSPDGRRIHGISMGTIDADTGRKLLDVTPTVQGRPGTCGWAHWGRSGFVGFTVGGILFTDDGLHEAKWIGSSKMVECSGKTDSCQW